MRLDRIAALLAVSLALASAPSAWALVPGGGPKKTDCFAAWQVTNGGVTAPTSGKGKNVKVICEDGNVECDADGALNGSCTIGVSICAFQTFEGCTPVQVTTIDKIKVMPRTAGAPPVPPGLPADAPICGTASVYTLRLEVNKRGVQKPSKPLRIKMRARAGKPDPDRLVVQCTPGKPACPANPQGGPRQLELGTVLNGTGGDLDNGWNGISHNFPIVGSSILNFCLTDCDGASDTSCVGVGKTGENTRNGATWGAPLPLLTAGQPVCVVNRFGADITASTADYGTGVIDAKVPLRSDVYLTGNVPKNGKGQVCPQCSGNAVGDFGTCIGGRDDGQVCRVDGTTRVEDSTGNKDYRLSAACRPSSAPIATLTINLDPFRTGEATGGKCPGQVQDDPCGGAACDSQCTGNACVRMVADPVNPLGPQVCQDHKGGISQLCCHNDTTKPCYTTAAGDHLIHRVGSGTPATPSGLLPSTSTHVFASVFCEPKTNNSILDVFTTGLPGPGALLQPMTGIWTQ